MTTALPIIQILISLVIVVLVLLQERSAGMSGIFGGDGGGFYQTRRGMERIALWATVVCAIIFAAVSVAQLVLR
jgi:protein translocase SecG subunit